MSAEAARAHRRDIRRSFGADAMDSYVAMMRRVTGIENLLCRGFFGRLRWLLFGR